MDSETQQAAGLRLIAAALAEGALPGETLDMDATARDAAAAFVAGIAAQRQPGTAAIGLASIGGDGVQRRLRLAVVNDDMPFLVDSVAVALAARGIAIHRLLHPVLCVRRDASGALTALLPNGASGERRESMIYLEIDRIDARERREVEAELADVLADVRAAVEGWPALQQALRDLATGLPDGEGAALLRWFLERHFTLLGAGSVARDGTLTGAIGMVGRPGPALWLDGVREAALRWFEEGGPAPLVLKSDRVATVHRRAPLDLLVVPMRREGRVEGLSIVAGLWTSAALRAPSDKVPVLRARLAAIEEKYGFDPTAHAGKALRHALSALPHDLMVSFEPPVLEELALTAMSLADRPRPKLLLAPGPLLRHLFVFVWVPRDQFSVARREAIRTMLEGAAGATVSNWTLDLGEGDTALIRYTLDLPPAAVLPDAAALDRQLEAMLRGWAPGVEAALGELVAPHRAARLALEWAEAFPVAYRAHADAAEAAADVARLAGLGDPAQRAVRLYRAADDTGERLRLKTYRLGALIPLSEAVPVFEHFGFRALQEMPTPLDGGRGYLHEFVLQADSAEAAEAVLARADVAEAAIAAVLAGQAENDAFNALIVDAGLDPGAVVLLRAWFRYLRQTGFPYGLATVADALRNAPDVAGALIALFTARHGPDGGDEDAAEQALATALGQVASIEDDRILRRLAALVRAILRTNAFAPAADEALAFKLDSAEVPGLPKPLPWREIWIYSPRVEGIHLRGGPIARGGLRWSDRRDDFRTEVLGLMKAQVVKNAVIVPTGAKGGFYPKQLPPPANRDAWLAEGTESYRIFIRALLSVTDNLVEGAVVHPDGVRAPDGDDPYFVVAADKGTATFSDVANAIAVERGFWLGDAFASGGSHGYDHKAMGITARGAWVSVQRHFREMGVDVQADPVTVVGCGDMSGDVFGNGMLLSRTLRLVAAFDHRHIFFDPTPDPARSFEERARMFALPRSSWADYDPALISPGGGVFPRTQKVIPLSAEVRAALGVTATELDPSSLVAAIVRAPVDLLWFGGIGTYVKAAGETNSQVGDVANDAHRVDGLQVRARVIGEGANLGVTQAGRIEFATKGGRINTDFIDNSAGVDCSDNEVNIKIALNREMMEGRIGFEERNLFLGTMTDDVASIVLEDNRLQTLGLSLAEAGGAGALPAQIRVIELLEDAGRIDRTVDGIEPNPALLRRATEDRGLTRPELAIILSHGKLALQAAVEASALAADPLFMPLLHAAFPTAMRERFAAAIDAHRLRPEIIATKIANRVVNRLGLVAPFELAEEEGASLAQVASAYFAADAIFKLEGLFEAIESISLPEPTRLMLLAAAGEGARLHVADLLHAAPDDLAPGALAEALAPGLARLENGLDDLLRQEARWQLTQLRARIGASDAPAEIVDRLVTLHALDGAVGTAALAHRAGADEVAVTQAYVRLGEALGLDWAKAAALRFVPTDPWERLLAAGLARDFEQLRLAFLARAAGDPLAYVEQWLAEHALRVAQFERLIDRARQSPAPSAAMLAQVAAQARTLLGR
ncbi:NAD-glutamate dehydrogenase [Sphingomonas nostoxanthinifaciens]|uniref:NAD-glutamate dehydrogenase n=1 Tax=Sphingomonas nostoxanthinifaciens TaxID=2872652 RepID=UPI001CC1D1CD|nr:NAD-glutamate dehydrogenase domain-containing protein [Sphingomonas nostoxanthinifaciens]UAK24256.1 NAD-glutamate dehydrogenase [Sphingomonas nostoxanthinifaciens]